MKARNQMRTNADLPASIHELIKQYRTRIERVFSHYLGSIPTLTLKSAMEYTLYNGGKRIRPLLIYATGETFAAPLENLDIPAASVELIHTYSLIHDDLPCMDNADLRRGKPTCHKAYDEGMAVLTGDALHSLAMQIIASHPAPLKAQRRIEMMKVLSTACGPFGMAAGQALDITIMTDENISTHLLENIYRLKTGALFSACIQLGYLGSLDENEENQTALKKFGDCIGLAFQIQDDILDVEINSDLLGKTQGMDDKNNKVTYVKLHGLIPAKEKVQSLYREALQAIEYLGAKANFLRQLTSFMLERQQ